MGDMADYYRELDEDDFDEELESEYVWTTKEGKRIPISTMTDSHLTNSIKYLYKNNKSIGLINILISETKERKLEVPKRPIDYRDMSECDATECDIY